jgi:hypothetical protein
MSNKYAIVTAISSYRMRYAIPIEDLQNLNKDAKVELEWAADAVTCNEVEEFSQLWLGEQIIDVQELDEEQILELFDKDNDYLKNWSRDQKLNHIKNWVAPS